MKKIVWSGLCFSKACVHLNLELWNYADKFQFRLCYLGSAICYDGLMQCDHSTAQAKSHDNHKKAELETCRHHVIATYLLANDSPLRLSAKTLRVSVEKFQDKSHKKRKKKHPGHLSRFINWCNEN